ncbi:hypothetical protein ACTFIV_009816 [Dictyostelium citrinum]
MSNINKEEYDDEEMKAVLKDDSSDSDNDDVNENKNLSDSNDDDSDDDSDDSEDDNMESKTDYENSSEGLEVGILEIKLREDPYSFEKNLNYINALSKFTKQSNYQTLREAREKFQSIHPLTQEIWLVWFSDEQKYMKTDNDKQYILSLYEKALNDFISVKINVSYCKFIIKINTISGLINNVKKIREQFERSLEQCGDDIIESPLLWTEYRMFEQMLLSQIKDDNEKQSQTKTIRDLYHRQLSHPMIGLDSIYNDYQQWEDSQQSSGDSNNNNNNDNNKEKEKEIELVKLKFEKALKQFKERESFEISLKAKKYLDQRKWKEYIEFEKQHGKPMRVVTLFERQLKYFSNHYSIWSFYLIYLEKVIKLNDLRLKVFSRSLRSIYYSGEHWSKYLLLLEESNDYDNDNDKKLKIEQEFQRSLVSGLKSEYDYQLVYNTYIDYHWRSIKKTNSDSSNGNPINISENDKQLMKTLFETMNNQMSIIDVNNYTAVDRYMYIAQFEWRQFNDLSRYREIVDYVLSIDPSQYWVWSQYISFEMEQKQFQSVRELFKKASSHIRFDDPSSRIWQDWFTFERGYGDLDQYKVVSDRYTVIQNKYNKEQEIYLQQQQKQQQKNKRKEKYDEKNKEDKRKSKKQKSENNKTTDNNNNNNNNENHDEKADDDDDGEFKKPLPPPKKQKEKDLPKKLIILNLPFDTVETDLHKIFDKYGQISSLKLVFDKNGKSKGICFILYKNHESANKALEMDQQIIKNRTICVQYSKDQQINEHTEPDQTLTTSSTPSTTTTTTTTPTSTTITNTTTSSSTNEIDFDNNIGLTVFINNLSPGVNKDKLEQFLQHNGVTGIKDVRVVLKARPFAYVDLIDKENLKKALSLDKKYFMSKSINVNLSKPPSSSISPSNNNINNNDSISNANDTEFKEIPTRKPTLLIPRGIKNKK